MPRRANNRQGQAPVNPMLQDLRQEYGLIQQPGGGYARGNLRDFQSMFQQNWNTPSFNGVANPGYRPVSEQAWGQTPMSVPGHPNERMGTFDNRTGAFNMVGVGKPSPMVPPNSPQAGGGRQPYTSVGNRNGVIGGGGSQYHAGGGPHGGANAGFPATPGAPPNSFALTPAFEAAQRSASDAYSQQQMGLQNQMGLIDPTLKMQLARMGTDQGYANTQLLESLANRGVAQGGVYPYLQQRDINIPYGRQAQDLGLGAASQYANLAGQMGGAGLGYNQAMMNAYLQNANDLAARPPWAVPQSGYDLPGYTPNAVGPRRTSSRRRTNKGGKGANKSKSKQK